MFSFSEKLHQLYQIDYQNYLARTNNLSEFSLKRTLLQSDELCDLWFFESDSNSNEAFLIAPSLFNSAEILFLNKDHNLIEFLKSFANVYLLEWKKPSLGIKLHDYTKTIAEKTQYLAEKYNHKLHLLGHCIGGTIALLSVARYGQISSLTLLTTPWDYSHFQATSYWSKLFGVKDLIANMEMVPQIYQRIMFFLLFPAQYELQLDRYFSSDNSHKEKYLSIEKWLHSGVDMPVSLYNQIVDELIGQNILTEDVINIGDQPFTLKQVQVPTCLVAAQDDRIAPINSIIPLKNGIQNSTLINVKGGHIAYLVNNDLAFRGRYLQWIKSI